MKTIPLIAILAILLPANAVFAQDDGGPTITFDTVNYMTAKMAHSVDQNYLCMPRTFHIMPHDNALVTVTDHSLKDAYGATSWVPVHVWSDSDRNGMMIIAYETQTNSGVFKANITLTDGQSSANSVHVDDGDTITAKYSYPKYVDGKPESQEVTTTAFLGWTGPPMERASVSNPWIVNDKGQNVAKIETRQQVTVNSRLTGDCVHTQPFAYLVQIQKPDGTTTSLSWLDGSLEPRQSMNVSQSWIPLEPGNYTVQTFIWQSINNPNALGPPASNIIEVT